MQRKKLKDPLVWAGIVFMSLLILFAIFGPMIPTGMKEPVLDPVGSPHMPYGTPHAPLGTDEIGRSFLQRIAYGARVSLLIGFAVQTINLTFGVFMGVVSTFAPRWIAVPVMRLTDGMFAFPDILLAILIIGILGPGWLPVIVALSVTGWPSMARLTKTTLASIKEREFVVAARATGASTPYLVMKHLLPQISGILLAVSMIDLAGTILAESTLSFLGIGVQMPTPSWGGLINNARVQLNSYPTEIIAPCLVLSLTVFALNFIGDGLRAYFDPKSRNA
ncbi:MAG: ABC transporter permease [Armatimonadetes bacterium]|nr:ABC transporter permease subunit [Armatimonadota bacterium]MBS1700527.1 ABC transporter permease [Armatimonadota bacterium]